MAYEISLKDKVAVVTGGGGGIGSEISRTLAEAGASVVLTYRRSREKTEAVAAGLPGENHLAVQAPVDDSESLSRLADEIEKKYGRLDILVNNAGITRQVDHEDLDGLDDDLIDSIFRTNWRGAFACIRALKSLLAAGDGGVVINISSIAGKTGIGSNVAYCASKAAMDSMTRSLGRALAPKIRVVSVAPGWTDGPLARRMDPAMIQGQLDRIPMGRLGKPEDAAKAVLAAAALLPFSSGSVIPVDGARPFI
jgi:3-oxoacyl-[acyl-carrier protein] reductase